MTHQADIEEAGSGAVTIPMRGAEADGSGDPWELPPARIAGAEHPDDQVRGSRVNPAVVALLDTANRQERNGHHDRAAASLERALQIEPREAWLWHRLGQLRLMQGQPDQAEHLALRSNTLAQGNIRLTADNWSLIADARRRRGDDAGARSARQRAAELIPSLR